MQLGREVIPKTAAGNQQQSQSQSQGQQPPPPAWTSRLASAAEEEEGVYVTRHGPAELEWRLACPPERDGRQFDWADAAWGGGGGTVRVLLDNPEDLGDPEAVADWPALFAAADDAFRAAWWWRPGGRYALEWLATCVSEQDQKELLTHEVRVTVDGAGLRRRASATRLTPSGPLPVEAVPDGDGPDGPDGPNGDWDVQQCSLRVTF